MSKLDFYPQDFSRWQIAHINSLLTFLLNFELKESFSSCLRKEKKAKLLPTYSNTLLYNAFLNEREYYIKMF